MTLEPLPLRGAFVIRDAPSTDDRGDFRRIADLSLLSAAGADCAIAQLSVARNQRRGTVRGLHWQAAPHTEAKTLWCSAGSVFDVLVDIRPEEPTYGQVWFTTLAEDEPTALHVPAGVAHGYQTLVDNAAVSYAISAPFHAESARALHFQDPHLKIPWPVPVSRVSERDRQAPTWPPR